MIIVAKFASVCPCCSTRIAVGAKVEWSRGEKAKHVACAGKPAVATAATPRSGYSSSRRSSYGRGTWTGCSCGSRTDAAGDLVNYDRACSSCQHDA